MIYNIKQGQKVRSKRGKSLTFGREIERGRREREKKREREREREKPRL